MTAAAVRDTYTIASGAGLYLGAYAPAALPAWRVGQAVGEWREIAGSSMTLAPNTVIAHSLTGTTSVGGGNNYGARLDAWGGAAIDTRVSRVWTVAAGGHGDFWNNEVCYQDLSSDTPHWVIHHAGSSGNVVDVDSPNDPPPASRARYADGLPCSRHTYYQTQFIERHNRAITCGGSISAPGSGYQDIEAFDVTVAAGVNGWDALYTYPGLYGAAGWGNIEPACCKDPTTEAIYAFHGIKTYKVSPSAVGPGGTASIVVADTGLNSGAEGATAVDTLRNRLFWTHGFGLAATSCFLLNLTDYSHTTQAYTGAAAAAFSALSAALGVVYVPVLDAYLLRGRAAGAVVYSVNASTFEVTLLSTTGGAAVPAQAGSGYEGVYNKWLYAPALGGVVYFPGSGYNSWFLRVH